jgi:hypothetical protein
MIIQTRIKELIDPMVLKASFKTALNVYKRARRQLLEEYNWSEDVFQNIPIYEEIKSYIYRKRAAIVPKTTNNQFLMPESFKETLRSENFCITDETILNPRIIIFMNKSFVSNLLTNWDRKIYCDGTFFSSPRIFSQLYH